MNKNPYPIPWELPTDERILAKLALQRMTSTVDMETKLVDIHSATDGSPDVEHPMEEHSWLMYTYTPKQMKLAANLPKDRPVYIEGPFGVYLRKKQLKYFVLKADPSPEYWQRKKDLEKFNTDDGKYNIQTLTIDFFASSSSSFRFTITISTWCNFIYPSICTRT
jgi:signaling intermediate in Toll pathway protein